MRFLHAMIHTMLPVLLLAPIFAGGAPAQGAEAVVLSAAPATTAPLEQPLVYWREAWTAPRPVQLHFLKVDLQSRALEVTVAMAKDPDGPGPAEAMLTTPTLLASQAGALAAINANAFRALPNAQGQASPYWFTGKPVDIAGLAAADGALRSKPEKTRLAFWIDAQGRPRIGGNPTSLKQVRVGVADWIAPLIANGRVLPEDTKSLHPRTLLGLDRGERHLLLVVADGRQAGYSEGLTMREAADLMAAHGCYNALNLDGGGSSIMLLEQQGQLKTMNRPSGLWPRPIPNMLVIRERKQAGVAARQPEPRG